MTNLIYTTYFARVKVLDPNKFAFISIAGKAPEGWEFEQYKKLAPSWSIWSTWHNAMHAAEGAEDCAELKEKACQTYVRRFKSEILAKLNPQEVLRDIRRLSPMKTPVLVCYERPEDFCHRHIVAEWLSAYSEAMLDNDAGYDNDLIIREWEPPAVPSDCGFCIGCSDLKVDNPANPRCINVRRITRLMNEAMTSMLSLYGEWNKIGVISEYFMDDRKHTIEALEKAGKLFDEFKREKSLPLPYGENGDTPAFCECKNHVPEFELPKNPIPRKIEIY